MNWRSSFQVLKKYLFYYLEIIEEIYLLQYRIYNLMKIRYLTCFLFTELVI
jgi:hypothetical protein